MSKSIEEQVKELENTLSSFDIPISLNKWFAEQIKDYLKERDQIARKERDKEWARIMWQIINWSSNYKIAIGYMRQLEQITSPRVKGKYPSKKHIDKFFDLLTTPKGKE